MAQIDPRFRDLTDTAAAIVNEIVRVLADRFTGEITIQAYKGGVRTMKAGTVITGEYAVQKDRALARPQR